MEGVSLVLMDKHDQVTLAGVLSVNLLLNIRDNEILGALSIVVSDNELFAKIRENISVESEGLSEDGHFLESSQLVVPVDDVVEVGVNLCEDDAVVL